MKVEPYLFFDFKESPNPEMNPPNSGDKVMHACVRIGDTQGHGLRRHRFGVSWMVIAGPKR